MTCRHCHQSTILEERLLLGLKPPTIILPIHILDLETRQFLGVHVIETRDINPNNFSYLRLIECVKSVNAAGLAELLMMRIRLVDVISNCVGTGEEFEVFGLSSDVPEPGFPAGGTVASACFCGEIETDFEFDCAADAASVELFE
jgi:hypothetical protein